MSSEQESRPRRSGPVKLARQSDEAFAALAARFGFHKPEILKRWRDIAGAHLFRFTRPQRISFAKGRRDGGTLYLEVAGAASVEVHHVARQLIERINAFYGYAAIAKIRVVATAINRPPPVDEFAAAPPDPDALAAASRRTARIKDPELRRSLATLGALSATGGPSRPKKA